MAAAAAAAASLPEEIIVNILMRLPAKSLGRFRCVSKPWGSLINHPSFIRNHVNRVNNIGNDHESAILFFETKTEAGTGRCKITSFDESTNNIIEKQGECDHQETLINNPTMELELLTKDIDFPAEFRSDPIRFFITGSCDGIILMTGFRVLLLWNPSINEYKSVPISGIFLDGFGIGYDASADDYKIFRVPSNLSVMHFAHSSVEVFELKSNSWKTIHRNFPYIVSSELEHSTFCNGAVHFVMHRDTTQESLIVYFDAMEGNFGKVPLPYNEDKSGRSSSMCLRPLRGNLCLLQQSMTMNGDINIWVMKEYGVRESWTKLTLLPLQRPGKDYIVVKVFSSADILFADSRTGDFVMYDSRYKKFSNISGRVRGFVGNIAYVKSLVSPFGSGAIVRN